MTKSKVLGYKTVAVKSDIEKPIDETQPSIHSKDPEKSLISDPLSKKIAPKPQKTPKYPKVDKTHNHPDVCQAAANAAIDKSPHLIELAKNANPFNMFDSNMYEDIKHFWSNCHGACNNNFESSAQWIVERNKNTHKVIDDIKDVVIKGVNQNIHFAIQSTSCKTTAEFVDLYHKAFNANFNNISKLYMGLTHFYHDCHNANYKHIASCLKCEKV